MYQSIKDVSANYDALVDLLESIEQFLNRLDIYIKFPSMVTTTAMGEIIVKIMVELLSTIALVTKQIKENRSRESLLDYLSFDDLTERIAVKLIKKFWGEKEVEAVLHRLDRLSQDEARMATAQTLEVVYGLVQNMRMVIDGKAKRRPGLSLTHCLTILSSRRQGIGRRYPESSRYVLLARIRYQYV